MQASFAQESLNDANAGIRFSLSDEPIASSTYESDSDAGVHMRVSDVEQQPQIIGAVDHQCVSHSPGRPRKPRIDRPGDINESECPSERYRIPDCERAGHPHAVAWWAKCAIDKDYSACYVGGGNAWVFPGQSRPRHTTQEGTWGLDYDGLFKPRRVWMNWSKDREQGGLGAYETDREPGWISKIFSHH